MIKKVTRSRRGGEDTLTYAFKHLFGSEGRFKNLYWQMVILFVSLMAIFVIIGVIRSQFTKEPTESIKKMVGTSFWSMFKMLLVPIFFFFALLLTAQIFAFLLNAMSGGRVGAYRDTGAYSLLCRSQFKRKVQGDFF